MLGSNILKGACVLLITSLILSSVAATVVALDKQKEEITGSLKIGCNSIKNPYPLNDIVSVNSAGMFTQLPALPGDPMPEAWVSSSPMGWRCHEDFWDITSPICDIHWWGLTAIYDGNTFYPSDPEGLTFNIVFYENDNGKPGEVFRSYVDVMPSFVATGIMYNYPDLPEGPFELFYFKININPCCELSDGWVSIQSIYSPDDSVFGWIESLDGNDSSFQYGWGNWFNLSDLAFMLTDGEEEPIPDLICEGNLNWKNVAQGNNVTGNFSVANNGDPRSILHWKIESYPDWGMNWTFTPAASILNIEAGWTTVDVEVIAPDNPSKRFKGTIKVVNAEDPSNYCEIPVGLKTSLNHPLKKPILLKIPDSLSNVFPALRQFPIKNLDKGFIIDNSNIEKFVPGEFIVKLNADINILSPSIDLLNEKYQVSSIEKVFKNSENPKFDNIYVISVSKESDILSIVKDYSSCSEVVFAEPNYIAHACTVPNDPGFNLQWALHNTGQTGGTPDADIDASEAWDIETGDENIVITISDTGVDWDHPDLAVNIWSNSDEILDGTDTDGNGFIDDIRGWDFVNNDNDPIDDNGHGTCCSGIAGAVTDNNVGMAGICWNCKIMPVKGLDADGYGTYQDLAEGIIYAAENGADVISMSWGGIGSSTILEDAIDYAYYQGVILVAAAHNYHTNRKYYPAAYDSVIGVAATYYNDEKMFFSNYGSWVDVAAPGYDIYTTALGDNYTICFSGTSAATPHVAGLAGLILSKSPSFNPNEVRTIIRSTTDSVKSNQYIGTGRITAYQAIQRDSTPIANLNSSLDEANVYEEIAINGTASGTTFVDYSIYYGVEVYPDEWILIHESSTPVIDGVLAIWEPPLDLEEETCTVRLIVHDTIGQISEDRAIVYVNLPPDAPSIDGPTPGKVGKPYTYTLVTKDPNDDDVYYYIDWGDGSVEDWFGPYPSGEEVKSTHIWDKKGTYTIKAKVKDVYDAESDWTEFWITIPRNKAAYNSFLLWLLERFPLFEGLLYLLF